MKLNRLHASCLMVMLYMALHSSGQLPTMITQGKITFERKVNAYGLLRDHFNFPDNQRFQQFSEQYKANYPQFHEAYFDLYFNDSLSVYMPDKAPASIDHFIDVIASGNTILHNLHTLQSVSSKSIAGTDYLIKQPLKNIKWRYTNDTREILGFHCHRANAIILDSIYVVAFYTDQITAKAGPESFWGLPGMILEIALPNNYILWEAKKVTAEAVAQKIFSVEPKGAKSSEAALMTAADTFLKANIGVVINWFLLITQL